MAVCGIFTAGIFAARIFAAQNFRREEFSPRGIFAARNFRRREFSPHGIFAAGNFRRGNFRRENFRRVEFSPHGIFGYFDLKFAISAILTSSNLGHPQNLFQNVFQTIWNKQFFFFLAQNDPKNLSFFMTI